MLAITLLSSPIELQTDEVSGKSKITPLTSTIDIYLSLVVIPL